MLIPVPDSVCDVIEDPPGTFTEICTAELNHFSTYAVLAPLDSDNDGVFDDFDGDVDNCPDTPNPNQEDTYPPGGNGIGDACECEGNFNCTEDDDCDGSNAAEFKADFGRSSFNRPCTDEDPCNGDFQCRGQVDGSDAALFKSDFGRSSFSNPCPMCQEGMVWCSYPE